MSLGRLIGFAVAILIAGSNAAAQDLIVSRNVNLRPDPSTTQPARRLMLPGSELFLLEPNRTNNYYHVRTVDGLEGWAYAPRIAAVDPGPSPPPPAGPEAFFNGCRPEGSAQAASIQARSVLKNRSTPPVATDVVGTINLAAILVPGGDETRFDNTDGATVIGFVHDVRAGGEETVNCGANTVAFKDTHLELTLSGTDTLRSRRFVVEVTPKWRAFVATLGQDWSTTALRNAFEGRCVTVTGWMFFDASHRQNAINTRPNGTQIHRATAWEIHPVTAISEVPCT